MKAVPLSTKIFPQYLKECIKSEGDTSDISYKTHIVGKWHLGHYDKKFWPTNRGFDSYMGILLGNSNYSTHYSCDQYSDSKKCGYDFRVDERPAALEEGIKDVYATDIYTSRIEKIIEDHDFDNQENPLFMYYAGQSPHAPLQVPEKYTKEFEWVTDPDRRTYYGMVKALDDSIGSIVAKLKSVGEYENTLIVFSSDNGGDYRNGGFNYPLKGKKEEMFEGGYRAPAILVGPGVPRNEKFDGLFHVTDWMPTLMNLVGCQKPDTFNSIEEVDGVDQSEALQGNFLNFDYF